MNKHAAPTMAPAPNPDQVIIEFNGFTLEVCMDEASLHHAFHLRYLANVDIDAITENEEELLYDAGDFQPHTRVHLVWYEGRPVATIRSCIYSEAYDWPVSEGIAYFPADIEQQIGRRVRILESNRFAVHPDFQGRQSLMARLLLFWAHGLILLLHQCAYIITVVRAKHIRYYQRMLGMEPISTEPRYVDWANTEAHLLAVPIADCRDVLLKWGLPEFDAGHLWYYAICAHIPYVSGYQEAA